MKWLDFLLSLVLRDDEEYGGCAIISGIGTSCYPMVLFAGARPTRATWRLWSTSHTGCRMEGKLPALFA